MIAPRCVACLTPVSQRRVDDDQIIEAPEHNGERQRFIVWATLAGFCSPDRLTERIVAEVEREVAS